MKAHFQCFLIGLIVLAFFVLPISLIANNNKSALSDRTQISVTIGAGNLVGRVPVDMSYRTSLFETIYLATEMNAAGTITDIMFYNNFESNLTDKPTQIWLGETLSENLTNGWIPASQLTQVFADNVNYPSGINTITIHLTNPYNYRGGNLVMLVYRPWEEDFYWMNQDLFACQINGDNRSLVTYNDNTQINPDNPPTTGVIGLFPKTTFLINVDGMGSLSGNVSSSGIPLEGARVQIEDSPLYRITGANGNYSFPYIQPGTYTITASKLGYNPQSHTVTILAGQSATQNFALTGIPEVTVEGRVVGSDAPNVGIANATVSFTGYADYTTVTDAQGYFIFYSVYANQTYDYTITAPGYQIYTGQAVVGSSNLDMGEIVLSEMAYSPINVIATEINNGTAVQISWQEPLVPEEGWIHYDSGQNFNAFGTAGSANFEVAARFPADSLAAYAGGYLQAVKIWPAMGGNFVVHIWLGGNALGPGPMVLSQPIIPVLNTWNTVMLNTPILITGTEELWIGYLCDTTGFNPAYAGFDEGPAVNGFGNMILWQDQWTTLLAVNSYCDFNWNIQGYVGLTPPALSTYAPEINLNASNDRSMIGFKVWRLLQGQANNEDFWVSLNEQPTTDLSIIDTAWNNLPDGTYLWAVKSVYTGGVMSDPAFSNSLTLITPVGTIAGFVRSTSNVPIGGATVTCENVSVTTNTAGAYTMLVAAGIHSVTASHPNYQSQTQEGVLVQVGLTTTLNFFLQETAIQDDNIPVVRTELLGNTPNPFNPETIIYYNIKESTPLKINIYDMKGQLVKTLIDEVKTPGHYKVVWDGKDNHNQPVSSGVFFYQMQCKNYSCTKKMLLLK